MLSWLQPGGPMMLGAEFALNRKAFDGKPIYNELTDTPADRAEAMADWIWKSWMPSAAWIPGSWYWTKLEKAGVIPRMGEEGLEFTKSRDMMNRAYSAPQAIASSFGIKIQPHDVDLNFMFKAKAILNPLADE